MEPAESLSPDVLEIDALMARARKAQAAYEKIGSQDVFDSACQAVAWTLMEPERNRTLAELAVAETGLGNADDKFKKNHNKTLGLMRDLKGIQAFGHTEEDTALGLSTYLRPKGVVAAIVPSTNPLATPVNNTINALKSGNAIVLAPSPKGVKPLTALLEHVHAALAELGLPDNLVQMVPFPPSKPKTERLMHLADLVVVTGSQSNVRAGYSSGTPALGVGAGNVVSIIDETADFAAAAEKIAASKTFDNATSCSSENSIVAVDAVYDKVVEALSAQGGFVLNEKQTSELKNLHWQNGKLTNALLAKDIDVVLNETGLTSDAPEATRFLVAPQSTINADQPMTGEKMARFLALYRASDFDDAMAKAISIQSIQGAGHSISLHTNDDARAHRIALEAKTCRVIVNQAHCFATGGFFNNGMPFFHGLRHMGW